MTDDRELSESFSKIKKEIKSGKPFSEILDLFLDEALSLFGASTGSISLTDPEKKVLTIVAARGIDKDKRLAAKLPFNVGITGSAAAIKEVIYVANVKEDPRYVKLIDLVASELALPLVNSDETIGVLNLESKTENHFSPEQIEKARDFADELTEAIFRNRYNQEFFKRKKEEDDYSERILGYDPQILFLRSRIRTVAPSDASVLIIGESGTGKELVAKSIHNLSARKSKAFVALNCGVLNENLLESELFGHVKGAYTGAEKNVKGRFETADEGTLFLDEVGEMPPSLQVKLLRVLQEGEIERVGGHQKIKVDVRVISATNRDLALEVEKGNFRLDLYFRMSVIPIRIPTLRERRGDIPLLAHHFLLEYNSRYGKNRHLSQEAMQCLVNHYWQGNVRELENTIQYSVILSPSDTIFPESLPENVQETSRKIFAPDTPDGKRIQRESISHRTPRENNNLNLERAILKLEADMIREAFEKEKTQEGAAKLLGISRGALQYKIKNNPNMTDYNP
ncbi:MAG: sigma 54-interacting transcriptional regulator [Leptospira sp.]|nr:sigma 54-interacting transcriptional regulator [Leptospira sp.]